VFEDVPLRRVLKELERYRRGRILLLVEALAGDAAPEKLSSKMANSLSASNKLTQDLWAGPARFGARCRCGANAWTGDAERTKTGQKYHSAGPKSITARSGKQLSH
jgi:hypothetical protein